MRNQEVVTLLRENLRLARVSCPSGLSTTSLSQLRHFTKTFQMSLKLGDLQMLGHCWYVTHTGLVRLARRKKCCGINVEAVNSLCDPTARRFVVKATVYSSKSSFGFVGYGDADPSNIPPLVRGAEMRVAETRAVNRALRKAYGIGLCSLEELNTVARSGENSIRPERLPPQPAGGSGPNGRKVRDQLCQIIRHHQLDPNLVKAHAVDFCAVKTLKDATREQVEAFVK